VKSFGEICLWFCHLFLSNLLILLPSSDGRIMSSEAMTGSNSVERG